MRDPRESERERERKGLRVMTRMRGTLFWKGKRPPEGKLTIVDQVELVCVCVCKRVRETKQSEVKEERRGREGNVFHLHKSKKAVQFILALDAVQPHCVQYSHRIENQNNERIFSPSDSCFY